MEFDVSDLTSVKITEFETKTSSMFEKRNLNQFDKNGISKS